MYNILTAGLKSRFHQAKELVKKNSANFTLLGQFILTALVFFGLGIVYAQDFIKEPPPVAIAEPTENHQTTAPAVTADGVKNMLAQAGPPAQAGNFVASKNGTAYYLATCRNNIKEENKIYFKTEEDAKKSGFRPAKTCFK